LHTGIGKKKTFPPPLQAFGHYKATTYSLDLATLHGWFTQLVFMTGLLLKRYQVGLQVILEKKAGNIHIDNL